MEKKPTLTLIGNDGNAFAVIGAARKAARKAGWTTTKIERVIGEMQAGDYDHLLQVAMREFEVE